MFLPPSRPSRLGKDLKPWAGSWVRARACLEAHQGKTELLSMVRSRASQWVAGFLGNSAVLI